MKLAMLLLLLAMISPGGAAAEPRALEGFTRVEASAGTHVEIAVGANFSVDVSGRDAARIVTRVSGNTLIVEPQRGWSWRGPRNALVRVTMPSADRLDASSGAQVHARGLRGGPIMLEASSGARLVAEGTCSSFDADASSGASINAAALLCESGRAEASSGAEAHVHATSRLDVDASSGGDIYAHGNPGIGEISLSSGGSFRRVEG